MADPMTAPGPDLDALENTVDAMRQAGVSGVTLSVDEADALIAAARERDALAENLTRLKADAEQGIHPAEREVVELRDEVGRLEREITRILAGPIRTKLTRTEAALAAERQQREQAARREARLRAALKSLRNETSGMLGIADTEMRAAVGHSNVACLYLRIAEADAALAEGQDG